jgi:hypothetical protein
MTLFEPTASVSVSRLTRSDSKPSRWRIGWTMSATGYTRAHQLAEPLSPERNISLVLDAVGSLS